MASKIDYRGFAFPKQSSIYENCETEDAFREHVWTREKSRDRFTGAPLFKVHQYDDQRGEVCHLGSRGAHPEQKWDPANAILLSAANHRLSDARGNHRLRMCDHETGGPPRGDRKIRFTLLDKGDQVVVVRVS